MSGGVKLGRSRKSNSRIVKNAMERRRRAASALRSKMSGVEKRREALRDEVSNASATVLQVVTAVHDLMTHEPLRRLTQIDDDVRKKDVQSVTAALRKTTNGVTAMISKVDQLMGHLSREHAAQDKAARDVRTARQSVGTFMNETIKLVNDISHEVITVRPNLRDTLAAADPDAQGEDNFLISSFARLRTKPRTTPADAIFPPRRGAGPKRAGPKRGVRAIKGKPKAAAIKGK